MSVQRARATHRSAALHTDFAREFAARRFGDLLAAAIFDAMPTYKRGPRKGLIKGYIHWIKVEVGGWSGGRPGETGRVLYPGTQKVELRIGRDDSSYLIIAEKCFPETYPIKRRIKDSLRAIDEAVLRMFDKGMAERAVKMRKAFIHKNAVKALGLTEIEPTERRIEK